MLGIESQYRLRDLFRTIAQLELDIDNQRQRLGAIEIFEPYTYFCRVNRH